MMGSVEDIERLIRRAEKLRTDAKRSFSEGYNDIACFYAEQAIQLRIKAYILRHLGFLPRIHNIRDLLSYIYKYTSNELLKEYIIKSRERLRKLEGSYIEARYGSVEYDAQDCLNTMEEIFSLIENEESRKNIH